MSKVQILILTQARILVRLDLTNKNRGLWASFERTPRGNRRNKTDTCPFNVGMAPNKIERKLGILEDPQLYD